MKTLTTTVGTTYTLSAQLGQGGEGTVYALREARDKVAKIYHPARRTAERENKLQAMIANPPTSARPITMAWPQDVVYLNGEFVGFTMPYISGSIDLYKIINPALQQRHFENVDWRLLHQVAQRLVLAVAAIHDAGSVIGDLNQKNALVDASGRVTLVDCDSYQVQSDAHVYRCEVGMPDYLPPELHGKTLGALVRTPAEDLFSLAVLIFQLLMQGYHPFTGVPTENIESVPGKLDVYCIRNGIFPFLPNSYVTPPPHAPQFYDLHPDLHQLFKRCFVDGHADPAVRPSTKEWHAALETAIRSLRRCAQTPQHWYRERLLACPWCAETDETDHQTPVIDKYPWELPQPEFGEPGYQVKDDPAVLFFFIALTLPIGLMVAVAIVFYITMLVRTNPLFMAIMFVLITMHFLRTQRPL